MAYLRKLPNEGEAKEVKLQGIVEDAEKGELRWLREVTANADWMIRMDKMSGRQRGNLFKLDGGDGIVFSDVHGDMKSLVRMLEKEDFVKRVSKGEKLSLISLGDNIDRGPKQLEVVGILFSLKVHFPKNVVIIRGDHEAWFDAPLAAVQGGDRSRLSNVSIERYGPWGLEMYQRIHEVHMKCPLAAISPNKVLFLHGGVYPGMSEVGLINAINEEQIEHIVRGVPGKGVTGMVREDYSRGMVLFGSDVVDELVKSGLFRILVRGHDPLSGKEAEMFDGRVLTVFSGSVHDKPPGLDFKPSYGYLSLEKEVHNVEGILREI